MWFPRHCNRNNTYVWSTFFFARFYQYNFTTVLWWRTLNAQRRTISTLYVHIRMAKNCCRAKVSLVFCIRWPCVPTSNAHGTSIRFQGCLVTLRTFRQAFDIGSKVVPYIHHQWALRFCTGSGHIGWVANFCQVVGCVIHAKVFAECYENHITSSVKCDEKRKWNKMHLDHVCCKHSARILVTLLFNLIYLNSCFISYCVALSFMLFSPKRSNKLKQTSQDFTLLQSCRLANLSNWRCINMFHEM